MTGEPTYQLPINVIVEVMKGLHERVVLRTRVPALPGVTRQEGMAHILIDAQGVQLCLITEPHTGKKLFENGEALSILQQCGALRWTLQPPETVALTARLHPEHVRVRDRSRGVGGGMSREQIPSRQMALTPGQMQALPAAQKKVFALVNGRNTVEDIARLLSHSPSEVYHTLVELKRKHLIDL